MSVTSIHVPDARRVNFKLMVDRKASILRAESWLGNGLDEDFLYGVSISHLAPIEQDLDAGRYQRYIAGFKTDTPTVITSGVSRHLPMVHGADSLITFMDSVVDWIAATTYSKWSFDVSFPHVSKCVLTWYFQDPRDATMFKMVWG